MSGRGVARVVATAGGGRRGRGRRGGRGRGDKPNKKDPSLKGHQRGSHQTARAAPSIETSDFRARFHAGRCRAARYKVHMPLCECPKVVGLRQWYASEWDAKRTRDDGGRLANRGDEEDAHGAHNESTTGGIEAYSGEIQFDADGNIANALGRLDISSNNGVTDGEPDRNSDPFDNLIVVPDTKSTPAIYVCEGTNRKMFHTDGTACERKLAREIFGDGDDGAVVSTDKVAENGDVPPFKVNCAVCLLTGHQRNGFVAVVSRSLEEMQPTIQRARGAALQKADEGLHADHAHFVCALEASTLQSLLAAGKTRSKSQQVNGEILKQMKEGGVDLPVELFDESQSTSMQIAMGHHLTSLLYLLQTPAKTKKGNDSKNDPNRHIQYIMVLGYQDRPTKLELDLPGGKRHLAESTLEGAVREVEEECSLRIDRRWLADQVSRKYGGNLPAAGHSASMAADAGNRDERENDGSCVRVMEPEKVKGSASGDAFFVMPPPPPS